MPAAIKFPHRYWKPSAPQLKAIRAYCARIHKEKPRGIVIEVGNRYNTDDENSINCMNILRVSKENAWDPYCGWDDTDLADTVYWSSFKSDGVPLDSKGRALLDFYIYKKSIGDFHGELLGNAQAYADTVDGKPTIVRFSGTCEEFETVKI